jgi:hypothetical protein
VRARARRVRIGIADQVKKKFWAPGGAPYYMSIRVRCGSELTGLAADRS